ncbi:MAG: 50S ribosomal protein L18e [Candidatus Diapherotrites archaeon]
MKRTGPTHIRTRALVVAIEKHGKATKEGAYTVLSTLLTTSTRRRTEVNLTHLNKMGTTHPDKILLVPGIVLGNGTLNQPIHVAALRYTGSAKRKIEEAKGKAHLLEELVKEKIPSKKLVLVK